MRAWAKGREWRAVRVGFFHKFAGKDYEYRRLRDRYMAEAKRLLGVLDQRLMGREWIMGDDYTIADIATFPWVRSLIGFYGAGELVGIAVARGLDIPGRRVGG